MPTHPVTSFHISHRAQPLSLSPISCAPQVNLHSICAWPPKPWGRLCVLEGQLEMAFHPEGQQGTSTCFPFIHTRAYILALSIQCEQKDSGQAFEGLKILKEMNTQ